MSDDTSDVQVEHELFVRSFFTIQPPTRVVRQFGAAMRDYHYDAGEVIFERGSPPRRLFFVMGGIVELEDDAGGKLEFGPSSLIGITDLNLGRPHARTATAREPLHVLGIDVEDYLEILEDNFDFSLRVLTTTCQVVHELARELPADEVFPTPDGSVARQPWLATSQLNDVQKLLVIRDSSFASNSPVQPLVLLAQGSREIRLDVDEHLLEAGSPLDSIWLVADGRLRCSMPNTDVHGSFEAGSLLLNTAGIGFDFSPYEVTAERASLLVGIQKEDLFDMMEDHFGLARCAFAYLSRENERVRARRAELQATP